MPTAVFHIALGDTQYLPFWCLRSATAAKASSPDDIYAALRKVINRFHFPLSLRHIEEMLAEHGIDAGPRHRSSLGFRIFPVLAGLF